MKSHPSVQWRGTGGAGIRFAPGHADDAPYRPEQAPDAREHAPSEPEDAPDHSERWPDALDNAPQDSEETPSDVDSSASGPGRSKMVVSALLFVGTLALCGCAIGKNDLIARGDVSVEFEPARKGYYRDIHAQADDGGLRVTGYVRRLLDPGSLTVQVLTPAREFVAEEHISVQRPPRSSRVRHARFEVRLAVVPQRGSVMRLVHRPGAN